MKTILLLTVLLSVALTVRAAAVEAVAAEAAAPAEAAAVAEAAVPLETQDQLAVSENEVALEAPEDVAVDAVIPLSMQGRFFACPAGWVRYRNSCYFYSSIGRSWSSAAAYCATFGASLASAHNIFDYSFLQELTLRGGGSTAWMGGFYFQTWRWVDQTPFNYAYWSTQLSTSSYQCMHVNTRAGWSNTRCTTSYPSICVKSSDC